MMSEWVSEWLIARVTVLRGSGRYSAVCSFIKGMDPLFFVKTHTDVSKVIISFKSLWYFRFTFAVIKNSRCVRLTKKCTPISFVKSSTAVLKVIISFKWLRYFRFTFAVITNSRCVHFTKKCTPIFFVKGGTAVFKLIISFYSPLWYLPTTNMEMLPADNAVRIKKCHSYKDSLWI